MKSRRRLFQSELCERLESRQMLASDLEVTISTSHGSHEVENENQRGFAARASLVTGKCSFGPELNVDQLNGRNGFQLATRSPEPCEGPCPTFPTVMQLGDINGDAIDDILVGDSVIFGGHYEVDQNGLADLRELDGQNGFRITSAMRDVDGIVRLAGADAGDFNGDGFNDILFAFRPNEQDRSIHHLLFGGENVGASGVIELTNQMRISGEIGNSGIFSISSVGDFNGDGFDDLLLGDKSASPRGRNRAGAAYLVFGNDSLSRQSTIDLSQLDGQNGFMLMGVRGHDPNRLDTTGDLAGFSVGASDINGDGYADLFVGAPGAVQSNLGTVGKVYVMFGGPNAHENQASIPLSTMRNGRGFIIIGEINWNLFGNDIANAGDVNSDGYEDIIIGTRGMQQIGSYAYVILGGVDEGHILVAEPNHRVVELRGSTTGHGLNGVGDVNHDGYDDVIVADYYQTEGSAYLLFGTGDFAYYDGINLRTDLDGENGYRVRSTSVESVGFASDGLGDVNGDGVDDFIVEAEYDGFAKRSYVIFGTDSVEVQDGDVDGNGVVDFADFLIISANFGRTDATPEEGDLNCDGAVNFADFLLLSRDFGVDFRPEVVFHLDFDGQIRDGSKQTLPLAVGPSVTPNAPGPTLESGTQLSAGLWAGTDDDNNQILIFDHPTLDEVSQSAGAIVTWVNVDDQTEWNNIAKTICPQHEEPCSAFGRDRGIELQATNTSGVFGGIQGYSTDTFGPAHGSNGGPGGTETPSGEWVHVALAWNDQGQRTVYVNGVPGDTKADLADGVFGLNEPRDWIIGGDALPVDGDPNGRRLSGRLADFAILSGELGEETLREIIQGGIQNTGLPGLPPNQEPDELAPVFHLDFEELADASVNKLPLLAGDAVKLAPGEGPTLEDGRVLNAGRWEDETRDTNQLLVLDNPILDGVNVSAGSIVTWINPDDGDGFNNILKTVCPDNVEPCAAFGPDAGFELHASGPHAGVYGAVQGFLGNGNVFGPLAPEPFGPNPKVTDTPGGVWTHVALTWNEQGDRTIYLNGVAGHRQVGFSDGIEFGLNDPGDWTIGGDANASTPFNSDETRRFEGKLADFAIFDVELTDAQIETILREGVSPRL